MNTMRFFERLFGLFAEVDRVDFCEQDLGPHVEGLQCTCSREGRCGIIGIETSIEIPSECPLRKRPRLLVLTKRGRDGNGE